MTTELGVQEFWCQKNWIMWDILTLLSSFQILLGHFRACRRLWSLSLMYREDQAGV